MKHTALWLVPKSLDVGTAYNPCETKVLVTWLRCDSGENYTIVFLVIMFRHMFLGAHLSGIATHTFDLGIMYPLHLRI